MFYLFHLFRSFLPLHNPIGFGAPDFIELALTIVVVGFALSSRFMIDLGGRFAARTAWCMLALFILPIALRLAMLPVHPIPTPLAIDDFSYALLGDTLAHFRFSNAPHPLYRFFETFFVLQEPRYASVYPMGQGMAIAIGQILFRNPWAGVALSIGVFSAACYWMLRGWISPAWALLGGLYCALQFGALSQWMNSFWGGAVPATAGCLVYGALPRLQATGRQFYALVLGAGIGISILTRPYETIFLVLSVLLFFAPHLRRFLQSLPLIIALPMGALALTAIQNRSVTGHWTTLPYVLARYEYGIPTTFTWQPNPIPHRALTPQQELGFETQKSIHDDAIAMGYFRRFATRAAIYRFAFVAPVYLALLWFLWQLRGFRYIWLTAAIVLFVLGTNFYPYFYSHYIAAITCLFVLAALISLEKMSAEASSVIIFLCAAHFIFWYGLHFAGNQEFARDMLQHETGDAINTGDPQGRAAIRNQLTSISGKHLVFVRYSPGHAFEEWVYNAADIDSSRIVWARDLGIEDDETLRYYYQGRTAWLLQPDFHPPLLTPYIQSIAPPATETVVIPADSPAPRKPPSPLRFEDVH